MNKAYKKEYRKAYNKVPPFIKELRKTIKHSPELKRKWRAIQFCEVDPSDFKDAVMDEFMDIWE